MGWPGPVAFQKGEEMAVLQGRCSSGHPKEVEKAAWNTATKSDANKDFSQGSLCADRMLNPMEYFSSEGQTNTTSSIPFRWDDAEDAVQFKSPWGSSTATPSPFSMSLSDEVEKQCGFSRAAGPR